MTLTLLVRTVNDWIANGRILLLAILLALAAFIATAIQVLQGDGPPVEPPVPVVVVVDLDPPPSVVVPPEVVNLLTQKLEDELEKP